MCPHINDEVKERFDKPLKKDTFLVAILLQISQKNSLTVFFELELESLQLGISADFICSLYNQSHLAGIELTNCRLHAFITVAT